VSRSSCVAILSRREILVAVLGAGLAGCGQDALADGEPRLLAWYRANSGLFKDDAGTFRAIADGDRVALWRDASSNQLHLRQPDPELRPSLRLGAQNGYPAVRFLRSGSTFLRALRASDWGSLHSGSVTVFVVWRTLEANPISTMSLIATGAGSPTEIGFQFAYQDPPIGPPSDGMLLRASNGAGYAYQVAQNYGIVIPRAFSVTSASFQDGSPDWDALIEADCAFALGADQISALDGGAPTSPMTVGRDASASSGFLEGEILEIMLFDGALPALKRKERAAALGRKYAIQTVSPIREDGAYNAFPGLCNSTPVVFWPFTGKARPMRPTEARSLPQRARLRGLPGRPIARSYSTRNTTSATRA
jgi:hypothetical protein